jgi:hypothetical protein
MPTSKDINRYPSGMLDLLESICESRMGATAKYPSKKMASAARLRFYGLIRALRENDHTLAEDCSRLMFMLTGAHKDVLQISFPDAVVEDRFYEALATAHREALAMTAPLSAVGVKNGDNQ